MLKEPYEKILAKCHEIADDEKITDGWEAFSNLWDWLEQEAAQQSVQADLLSAPHGQSCACDKCKHKAVYEFKPASRSH